MIFDQPVTSDILNNKTYSQKLNQKHSLNLGLNPLLLCADTHLGLEISVTQHTIELDHQLKPDIAQAQNLNITPNRLMTYSFEPFFRDIF